MINNEVDYKNGYKVFYTILTERELTLHTEGGIRIMITTTYRPKFNDTQVDICAGNRAFPIYEKHFNIGDITSIDGSSLFVHNYYLAIIDIEKKTNKSIIEDDKYKQKLLKLREMYQNAYDVAYANFTKHQENEGLLNRCITYKGVVRDIDMLMDED